MGNFTPVPERISVRPWRVWGFEMNMDFTAEDKHHIKFNNLLKSHLVSKILTKRGIKIPRALIFVWLDIY